MTGPDVVVVGDGVLGLSVALALTRAGSRVVVVRGGPEAPAASRAAGAMLGCFGEVTASGWASPLGRPKVELALQARRRCCVRPGWAWLAWMVVLG